MTQTTQMTIAPFERTVSLGKMDYNGSGRKNCLAEITVKWSADGCMSFTGAIWNPRMTDHYAGGQCSDMLLEYFPKIKRLVELWGRWHLNDMRAGCEHQRTEGWDKLPIDPEKPLNAYGKFVGNSPPSWNMLGWVFSTEHPQGLLGVACPTCGYRYGTAWLKEEVPNEVVAEIVAILDGLEDEVTS